MSEVLDHVALYEVLLDGATVEDEVQARITEIRVLNYLALPDLCTFDAGFAIEEFDAQPFDIGKALEIRLGSARSHTTTSLFRGEILTLEPEFARDAVTLRVRAFDKAHRLQRARRIRTFSDVTVAEVATKVLQEAGLDARVGPGLALPLHHVQQDNESDWDFLWRLARRVGAEIYVEGDTARFERPTAADPIELEWPSQLRVFNPRVTAIQQVDEVTVRAYDSLTGTSVASTAAVPDQLSENGIPRSDVAAAFDAGTLHVASAMLDSQDEGDALAQAMLDQLANGYIAAEGTCAGDPRLRAGATVRVTGVGRAYSGTYRAQSTTHVLQGGGAYVTEFSNSPVHTIRGALGSSVDHAARRLGATVTVGLVSNNEDPEGLGRLKLSYPHYNGTDEGAWAQVAFANAGKARGQVMLPQVGDLVLVAFLHADTRFPVVLGSLYNGGAPPGDELLADSEGSYVLRSDMRIDMHATKEILVTGADIGTLQVEKDLTLESTGGAVAVSSAKDMTLTSGASMTGDVKQDLKITTSVGNVTVQASAGKVTLKGMAVEVSADTSLKLSGATVQVDGAQILLG